MSCFKLPERTKVHRVVPKNAFDDFTNTKQKKLFTEKVSRITWLNKLSKETVNLEPNEVKEIQIFKVELKVKEDVRPILEIIERAIPYHLIFEVHFESEVYISTSAKHPHPVHEDKAVVDWTFKSDWFQSNSPKFHLELKTNLDAVFKNLCVQLSGRPALTKRSLSEIVSNQQQVDSLRKEISSLKSQISKCKQFNRKVELNLMLRQKETELNKLSDSN